MNKQYMPVPKDRKGGPLRSMPDDIIFINGELKRLGDINYSFPHSFDYGGNSWGGAMGRKGKDGNILIYAPEFHAERTAFGGQELGFLANDAYPDRPAVPFTTEEMVEAMYQVLAANNNALHYLRPFVFLDGLYYGVVLPKDAKVSWGVKALPIVSYYSGPIRMLIVDRYARPTPISGVSTIPAAKGVGSGHYPTSTKVKELAHRYGCQDGLLSYYELKTGNRRLAEGSSNNVLFYTDEGEFVTPKPRGNFLYGGSAQTAIYLAREMGFSVKVRDVDFSELFNGKIVAAVTAGNAAGLTTIEKFVWESAGQVIPMATDVQDMLELKLQYDSFILQPDAGLKVPFVLDSGAYKEVV